jgi:DNA-binding LacI/PurR family transcriptional regulator
MEELAFLSGVSRPTLSKYFNDPSGVRPSTRARIEECLKHHPYQPNIFAMNQNRRTTKNIGILVPYLTDPFFAEIVRHIEVRCIEAGYWAVVLSSHGEVELEERALTTLVSLKPAGAVIAPLGHGSDIERIARFAEDVPTVIFDSGQVEAQAFVGTDNFHSIGLIVDYLCRTGEPPCFLEMPPVNSNARERSTAYVQAMERLGHLPQVIPTEGTTWEFEQFGYEAGLRLISTQGLPSPTILCANDRIAIGLLAAAYTRGLRVGRGPGSALRVAGHDDHPLARFTCPPLTTVAQNYTALAERSVGALFSFIQGGAGAPRPVIRLEGSLVMRASA